MKSIPLSKIRGFSGGNPKTPTEGERAKLAASIDTHGIVAPLIVRAVEDGTYELIDGHQRTDIYTANDPDGKFKCIVLDVESVAEGRRILLAMQGQVGFDMTKLEQFVADAIAEGVTAAQIIADTGYTGADLEALAGAGAEFLDGVIGDGEEDGEETNERASRAGLNPEHVSFGVPLTREQNATVHAAIKMAKTVTASKISGDALTAICAYYIEHHQE